MDQTDLIQRVRQEDFVENTVLDFMFGYKIDLYVFVTTEDHEGYLDPPKPDCPGSFCVYPYKINGMGMRSPGQKRFGRMIIVLGNFNPEVVMHEITHVVTDFIDIFDIQLDDDHHDQREAICRAAGSLAKQIYDFYMRNVIHIEEMFYGGEE